jgi:hypothetical protein
MKCEAASGTAMHDVGWVMESDAEAQPEPRKAPERRWVIADTPEVEGVLTARCCLGAAFRDGPQAYFCDGVCLSANLTQVMLELAPIVRLDVTGLEDVSSLRSRLAATEIGEEEAKRFRAVGWW